MDAYTLKGVGADSFQFTVTNLMAFCSHVIILFRFMWQLAAEFQAKRKELMPELDVFASYLLFLEVLFDGFVFSLAIASNVL